MDMAGWANPVMIVCRRSGQIFTITSTGEALDTLLNYWPVSDGKALLDAVQICSAALDGQASDRSARDAFTAAAIKADVPIDTMMAV